MFKAGQIMPIIRSTLFKSLLSGVVWLHLFFISGLLFFIWTYGDRTPLGTFLLFGPRWIWGIPFLPLVVLAIIFSCRLLIPLFLTLILFLFPIMQFSIPLRFPFNNNLSANKIRVLSYNIGRMAKNDPDFPALLEGARADIVALQECTIDQSDQKKWRDLNWHLATNHTVSTCLLSRFPILKTEVRDPKEIWKMGGSGVIVRYHLNTNEGPIYVVNLHLETPREGIEAMMDEWRMIASSLWHLRLGETGKLLSSAQWLNPPEMKDKIFVREFESKVAKDWVTETPHPVIVTGDFNMPSDSRIYREFWSDFDNTYKVAGFEFGNTKWTRWFGIRIDHILVREKDWDVINAWTLPGAGHTDHIPLMAEIIRPPSGGAK